MPAGLGGARHTDAVQLAASGVTIAGPVGYCADASAIDDRADGGFVLMVNCDALRGRRVAQGDDARGLLTASVSAPLSAPESYDPRRLGLFFDATAGQAALSRAGDPATVTVLESFVQDDAVFLHARDTAPSPLGAISEEYWRAVTLANGRLVTMTVTPYSAAPLTSAQLRKQVTAFAQSVTRANQVLPQSIVSE